MTPTLSDLQHALPEDLARKLNELAAERGLSPADVVLRHFQEQAREGVGQAPQSLAELKPVVPPPNGVTAMQFVEGKWPGDETEEELLASLKAMDTPTAKLSPQQLSEEIRKWRAPQSLAELKPRIPPPPGMTAMQFIRGHWPGEDTDTDADILADLKAMG